MGVEEGAWPLHLPNPISNTVWGVRSLSIRTILAARGRANGGRVSNFVSIDSATNVLLIDSLKRSENTVRK